jgi:cyanophycinase-like exopeptidase
MKSEVRPYGLQHCVVQRVAKILEHYISYIFESGDGDRLHLQILPILTTFFELHGVTTALFVITTVRTSNPTSFLCITVSKNSVFI